jgi:hypothetical protein
MDSCEVKYNALSAASILHALSYGTEKIVVFGGFGRRRWIEFVHATPMATGITDAHDRVFASLRLPLSHVASWSGSRHTRVRTS